MRRLVAAWKLLCSAVHAWARLAPLTPGPVLMPQGNETRHDGGHDVSSLLTSAELRIIRERPAS
jgi:hypothetical protein